MINASQEFKALLKKGAKLVNFADITLKDGTVLNLGPSDFSVGGFSMSDKTSSGKFEVGTTIGKTIRITIANHTNKFSAYDFFKAIIYVYVAIEKTDGTVLKERKGKYYVINPTTPSDTIRLDGVDSMYLFDKDYKASTAFPATLQTILSDCCLDCGVNIGFGEFDNWNFVVMNKPEDCTYRQVVSWVAQISGCYARINNNDYLELVWYDTSSLEKVNIDGGNYFVYENENIIDGGDFTTYESDLIIDGGSFTDYSPPNVTKIKPPIVSTDNVVITGVKVEYNKKEVILGNEDYLIIVKDNPFVDGKENEVCQYLADRLIGLSFRPLSCQMVNNPLFEPFDSCYVYDRKGNVYFTLINSVTYTISGFTTISCKAEDPVRNESSYVSESAKAIVQAKRETANQLTTYDKAVQNMNLLASNAMGLYRESETQSDGSIIYYMSNRPITKNDNGVCSFETNSVVYKMTSDGFFVSTDGGVTYTSGFDSEGNAVVNVLSAIGITFDWARGGTLSLGGDSNINGKLIVYDSKGNVSGKWDNEGITLPENTRISWEQLSEGEEYVTKITKKTVTTEYINALNVKAGSVDAENITGTKISGKELSGGSIKIGSYFSVDSLGNCIANSFESSNAKITGGSINIKTSSSSASIIQLNYGSYKLILSSGGIDVIGPSSKTGMTSSAITTNQIIASPSTSEITVSSPLKIYGNTTIGSAYTHKIDGSLQCSGSVKTTGSQSFSIENNIVKIGSSGSSLGFFGNSGSSKKSVSEIYSTSSATTSSNATKINEIIKALKSYNLL